MTDVIESEPSEDGKPVSKAVYWRDYYEHPDFSYEWHNGILEVKPMAAYAEAQQYIWFERLMYRYLDVYPIANLINLDIGFKLNLVHSISVRKPDLGVILHSNQVQMADADCTYYGVLDLCVESLSNETKAGRNRDVITKKREYEAIGVQEYYILDEAFARLDLSTLVALSEKVFAVTDQAKFEAVMTNKEW